MKKINLLLALLFTVSMLSVSSCNNNDDTIVYLPARTIIVNLPTNVWSATGGGTGYTTSISVPEITNQINTAGAVLVYITFGNAEYEAIPEVFDEVSYSFTHQPGVVNIDIQSIFNEVLTAPAFGAKIVLIDGQQIAMNPGVDLKDYNQVMSRFKPVEKTIRF